MTSAAIERSVKKCEDGKNLIDNLNDDIYNEQHIKKLQRVIRDQCSRRSQIRLLVAEYNRAITMWEKTIFRERGKLEKSNSSIADLDVLIEKNQAELKERMARREQ